MSRAIFRALWLLLQWLELSLLTLLLYALSWLRPLWGSRFYHALFRFWSRQFVCALGVDLRLQQHLTKPLPPRYLLIANHPSAFEDIGIPALFDVVSLAKAEVRHWWLAGRISAAAGTLFVQRESKDSRNQAARDIASHLAAGHNVALYPEGGVKNIRIHDSFRYGVFDISLRTGIPIVPVFIHYEAQWQFYWRDNQSPIDKLCDFIRSPNNCANYHVYDAIDPRNYSDKVSYCDAVHSRYLAWQRQYLE